ncbi:MAG TPA: glycolate oxidase subunit GlcE [Rhodocyclaceae bacterium]|nr:glycolate oxidase subunit GlcE [Rhodocyclaceae bacterium]
MNELIDNWRASIATASATHVPLRVRGGGSKDFYGEMPDSSHTAINTRGYRGVVEYEPSELYITARCGTPLTEIEATLAECGQMLAFEPPHFSTASDTGATVGGCIAAGLSGPRRVSAGAVRDFVLGARLLDGTGCLRTFGGQVMKNVAGFDVSRMLAGSLGTLGIITEVSLKTLPRPAQELTLCLEMDEAEAIAATNRWMAQALPLSATCWRADVLHVRLSGAPTAIQSARAIIGGEIVADDVVFWRDVREQRHAFFATPGDLWRVSVPALTSPKQLPGNALSEWFGAQRWLRDVADAAALRAHVIALGGHATLFRSADTTRVARFQPLAPALLTLHQRLKTAFDPYGVFNPGRMYPDF